MPSAPGPASTRWTYRTRMPSYWPLKMRTGWNSPLKITGGMTWCVPAGQERYWVLRTPASFCCPFLMRNWQWIRTWNKTGVIKSFTSNKSPSMAQAIYAVDKRENLRPFLLQFGIVFLLILTLPLDRHYYQTLGSIQIGHIHFQDLFQLANYVPFLGHAGAWGWESFAGWSWALALAFVAAAIWTRY